MRPLQTPTIGILLALLATGPARGADLSEGEAARLGGEAYIYGYPLVTMEMTRRVMTNVETPGAGKAPMGAFFHAREFPDARTRDVVAPSLDTLDSVAWLDLAREPYVLSLPDIAGRYDRMPMLSAWTDVFEAPGTRTTGTRPRTFAIVGPNWSGKLPDGMLDLPAPTNLVRLAGRIACNGTPDDLKAVRALQDRITLVPLSAFGRSSPPPKGTVNPSIDRKTPVRDQVHAMDAAAYFRLFARLLKDNPPPRADAPMVAKLAKLGIVAGNDFDPKALGPAAAKALQGVPKAAQAEILGFAPKAGTDVNGWHVVTKTGVYGTDYLRRAFVAATALGADRPQDVVVSTSKVDADGQPYDGTRNYILTFPKGQTPPVNGPWSLTVYTPDLSLAADLPRRSSLGSGSGLKANADGSVDLLVRRESPGEGKEANWLPAPAGPFVLVLRLHWPREYGPSILDGTWKPPGVKTVK